MRTRLIPCLLLALALAACEQINTTADQRAALGAKADAQADAFETCAVAAAGRRLAAGETAAQIPGQALADCAESRSRYLADETAYLRTQYVFPDNQVTQKAQALDARVTDAVNRRLQKGPPPAPAARTSPATPNPSAPAAPTPTTGQAYLDCMAAQARRYAGLNEPAEVVAEVAASRCAGQLPADPGTGTGSAAQLKAEGRTLVLGIVLDQKAGASAAGQP